MNATVFLFLTAMLLAAVTGAAMLRSPVHAGLSAVTAFVALGLFFIALGAEFVGFIQLLVYIGAVSILAVFAILLTRPESTESPFLKPVGRAWAGGVTALLVLGALLPSIHNSPSLRRQPSVETVEAPVRAIGELLLSTHLLPLQAVGVLLTAALIGAVLFASTNR